MRARICSAWMVLVLALIAAPSAHAASDASLTLTASDVPGLKAAGTGSKVGGSALGGKLPRALKGVTARGAAFSGSGGRKLTVGVYVTSGAGKAGAAVKQARGKGFKKVAKLGDEAWQRTTSTKKATTSTVVLRKGAAFGVVRFALSGKDPASAATAAQAYARALVARLERVLTTTEFDKTLDGIGDDGSVTPQVALRAFSMVYGSLPGAKRPTGKNIGAPADATVAIHLVARVWDKLTQPQKNAIDEALGAPHDDTSPPVARSAKQTLTPNADYQALADFYSGLYAPKLPGTVAPVVKVFAASQNFYSDDGSPAYADALPVDAAGKWGKGPIAYCRVRIPPYGQAKAGTTFFKIIIAHEVFHCWQFKTAPLWASVADWIIEGTADWAALSVVPNTIADGDPRPYRKYLKTPTKGLYSRSYDAVGLWMHADDLFGRGSLWPKIPSILNAGSNDDSFAAAGGSSPSLTETWASAMARFTGAGSSWHQTAPYDLPTSDTATPAITIASTTALVSAGAQTKLYTVIKNGKRPLVSVDGSAGSLRAGYQDQDFGVVTSTRNFCLGSCECPPGKEGEIPANAPVPGALTLALTGGIAKGQGRVTYHSMDEYCTKKEPGKGKGGSSGPAESNGDPHLTSLDGLHFDFQGAGEFLLARSKSKDLEVQAREEPYGSSDTVTVNTQIAVRIGGRRVTVSPGATPEAVPVVRIDGQVDPLPAGTAKPVGDGTLSREQYAGYVDFAWRDGSTLVVRPVGKWGVAMVLQLDGSRAGDVTGLLGNFDDDPSDDLADRKGKRIKYTLVASKGWDGLNRYKVKEEFDSKFFNALYDDVGDAWRISQAESLFDYGPGQSTKTFTKKNVPAKPVDPEEVQRARRAEAERICREHGVTQPGPLADCITDVAATGNAAFADDAFVAQQAASVVWTQLRGGTQITSNMSTATSGDGVLHVAFTRGVQGSTARQAGSVPIGPTGVEGPEETVTGADADVGLFAAGDGTVHAVTAEIPLSGPSGVYQYARSGDGSWAPRGPVTGYGSSYASRPSALATSGGLLTISPMNGVSRVFHGESGAGDGFPFPAPADCYSTSPAIARDSVSGAVYVAWLQWDCPQVGVFVAQVDPTTGAFAGPPVQAPGSSWTVNGDPRYPDLNLDEDLAFTGRPGQPGVFLAYESGPKGDVNLWRVGAPTATKLPAKKQQARHVRLAADGAGGRVWALWEEGDRFWIQRTTADGTTADGTARPAAVAKNPSQDQLRLFDIQIAARGGGLDLLQGYRRGDTPGALYRARITP